MEAIHLKRKGEHN